MWFVYWVDLVLSCWDLWMPWWIWDRRQWSPLFDCFTRSVHPSFSPFCSASTSAASSELCFVTQLFCADKQSGCGWGHSRPWQLDMEAHCTIYSLFSNLLLWSICSALNNVQWTCWHDIYGIDLIANSLYQVQDPTILSTFELWWNFHNHCNLFAKYHTYENVGAQVTPCACKFVREGRESGWGIEASPPRAELLRLRLVCGAL